MTARLPEPIRHRCRRTLTVPPPGHRAPINGDALRAAHDAHANHEHGGQRLGNDCRTCRRYLAALIDARARERQP